MNFSGSASSYTVQSTSNNMLVLFKSDGSRTGSGFTATYTSGMVRFDNHNISQYKDNQIFWLSITNNKESYVCGPLSASYMKRYNSYHTTRSVIRKSNTKTDLVIQHHETILQHLHWLIFSIWINFKGKENQHFVQSKGRMWFVEKYTKHSHFQLKICFFLQWSVLKSLKIAYLKIINRKMTFDVILICAKLDQRILIHFI